MRCFTSPHLSALGSPSPRKKNCKVIIVRGRSVRIYWVDAVSSRTGRVDPKDRHLHTYNGLEELSASADRRDLANTDEKERRALETV